MTDVATQPEAETEAVAAVTPCAAAAPMVVNGGPFVGCQLPKGHGGQHEVRVRWG